MGCAPRLAPGLSGPGSRVLFYSRGRIDTSALTVAGVSQGIFDLGIVVPEGEHPFSFDYRFEEQECSSYPTSWCFPLTVFGHCEGTLRTTPGSNYRIDIHRSGTAVFVSVSNEDTGDSAGAGSCSTGF